MFKPNEKILWFLDLSDTKSEHLGTVTRVGRDTLWVDNRHKPEDQLYSAYAWPVEFAERIRSIVAQRESLKKQHDDLMKQIYQLRNELILSRQ